GLHGRFLKRICVIFG
ncbi:hypothetical protein CP10743SC13_1730, partial [Chlamydia psittaci 10_743_SC13]